MIGERELLRGFDRLARDQIPFAASLAINSTLKDMKSAADRRISSAFQRKNIFTLRAIGVSTSSKRSLAGWIGVKPIQEKYLKSEEFGGIRSRKPYERRFISGGVMGADEYAVPAKGVRPTPALINSIMGAGAKSPTKGKRQSRKVFYVTDGDQNEGVPSAIWQRVGGRDVPLFWITKDKPNYRPAFGFIPLMRSTFKARMPINLRMAAAQAMRTSSRF